MSITHHSLNYAKVSRIQKRGVDLYKIDAINDLSRNITIRKLDIESVRNALYQIDHEKRYSYKTTLFFSAFSAFGFAGFFKGSWADAMVAFIIGMIIKLVFIGMEKEAINTFFNHAISASVAAICALLATYFNIADSLDIVIISSIMLLVPGLSITNAIRDTVAGDYLAGISRGVEAFLIAIAIAVGIATVFQLYAGLVGGI